MKESKILLVRGQYRSNGIEMMFFIELCNWITSAFPRLKEVADKKAVAELNSRLEYLESVRNHVLNFKFRETYKTLCPISTLEEIHKKLVPELIICEAKSDNSNYQNKLKAISDNLAYLRAGTLQYLSLMLEHPICMFEPEKIFNLPEIQTKSKQYKKFLETPIGRWIKSTLEVSGISTNSYESTKKICYAEIENHLTGVVCPHDLGLRSMSYPDGISKEERKAANEIYGFLIIKLLRSFVKMTELLQCLGDLNRTLVDYGGKWLVYNHGKTLNEAMLSVLRSVISNYKQNLQDFHETLLNAYEATEQYKNRDSKQSWVVQFKNSVDAYEALKGRCDQIFEDLKGMAIKLVDQNLDKEKSESENHFIIKLHECANVELKSTEILNRLKKVKNDHEAASRTNQTEIAVSMGGRRNLRMTILSQSSVVTVGHETHRLIIRLSVQVEHPRDWVL